jgi:hypothetical protein
MRVFESGYYVFDFGESNDLLMNEVLMNGSGKFDIDKVDWELTNDIAKIILEHDGSIICNMGEFTYNKNADVYTRSDKILRVKAVAYSLGEYIACIKKLKIGYPSKSVLVIYGKIKEMFRQSGWLQKMNPSTLMFDGHYSLVNTSPSAPTEDDIEQLKRAVMDLSLYQPSNIVDAAAKQVVDFISLSKNDIAVVRRYAPPKK